MKDLNDLYIQYHNDKDDYFVLLQLQESINNYIHEVLNSCANDHNDDLFDECYYSIWKAIANDQIMIDDQYNFKGYLSTIIHRICYKSYNEVKSTDILITDVLDIEKNIKEKELFNGIIDYLISQNYSSLQLQWFVEMYIYGKNATELSITYHVSNSYISRVMKKMIEDIRQNIKKDDFI